MIHAPTAENQTILFGVTSSQSLKLLGKIPLAMAEIGWNVHVVVGDDVSEAPIDLEGIKVYTVPMKRNPSPVSDILSLIGWIRRIRQINPAIVIIGTPKAALLGMFASLLCRVPIRVYQLRGLRLETVSGAARCVLYLAETLTARASTAILAVSPSLKQEYCRLRLCAEKKVEVLGLGSSHGVDTDHFHPSRWSTWEPPEEKLRRLLENPTPLIGFVGRFSKDKGARELLRCCQVLRESGISFTLLVIGPLEGDEEVLNDLKLFSRNTVITGPVPDVGPYYPIMDLLLLPTHREGFPNAVLEAAASGVPTVTTNATGAVDSVADGTTGVIVPIHDGDALAAAVQSLIANPRFLRGLGKNARKRAVSDFEAKTLTKKNVEYLLSLWESTRTNF